MGIYSYYDIGYENSKRRYWNNRRRMRIISEAIIIKYYNTLFYKEKRERLRKIFNWNENNYPKIIKKEPGY